MMGSARFSRSYGFTHGSIELQPAELAASYVMLASDESSYLTGTLLAVSGGKSML